MAAVEALFRFPPFFDVAAKKARGMIVERGRSIGLDWDGTRQQLQDAADWPAALASAAAPGLAYPAYYTQPFHAYPSGNLCWDAALEASLAAQAVHAPVMDPAGKALDPRGDAQLRGSYGATALRLMAQLGAPAAAADAAQVLDLGCGTGLSSRALAALFPRAHVTGVDLSPHFVAVGRHEQAAREAASGRLEPIRLLHGLAEATGLPDASFDVVSMCLVAHELPQSATKAILLEAHRVLRPGGFMCIMEMDPASPAFARIFANPFAYTAFKSTEPWLLEYITLDLHGAMHEAGFGERVLQASNTPRHRTVVARKPL